MLGVHQVANAALAALVALMAGATPTGVTESVAELAPMRRRMEIVRHADPIVLDDTVGNPRSLEAVFATIRPIPHRRLRIALRHPGLARRGHQPPARRGPGGLHPGGGSAGGPGADVERRRRRIPGSGARRRSGTRCWERYGSRGWGSSYEPTLAAAVRRVMDGAVGGDLVLLLGAQGMDSAAKIANEVVLS